MAAPTNAANVKKALANSEPSTHGTKRTCRVALHMSAFGGKADIALPHRKMSANDPKRTCAGQKENPGRQGGESDQGLGRDGPGNQETDDQCGSWLLLLFGKNETVVVVHFG